MKTKVLLVLLGAFLSMGAVMAQEEPEEDQPDDMPDIVITEGIPTNAAGGVAGMPAPIREHYGPSTLPSLPTVAQLIAGIARAEQGNNANDLVYAYGEAVRNPLLARGALTRLMYDYYRLRAAAITPEQAIQAANEAGLRFQVFQSAQLTAATQQNQKLQEQNEQIIQQNQQIIQLLQQIARKK